MRASILTALPLLVPMIANGATLCARQGADGTFNATVKIRETCKSREVQLDPTLLDAAPEAQSISLVLYPDCGGTAPCQWRNVSTQDFLNSCTLLAATLRASQTLDALDPGTQQLCDIVTSMGTALSGSCSPGPPVFSITCTALPASCSDGTRNQGETAVDCGGPCAACP